MKVVFKSSSYDRLMTAASVSIIVPVFNTERYVLSTLRSLEAEAPESHEIIVVHDGGTDKSLEIVCEWAAKTRSRVAVIDQQNAGLSIARASGLAIARGKYIGFLDSDDNASIGVYSQMAEFADENSCDIVLCRSAVFDSESGAATDFYDSLSWDKILAGKPWVTTNVMLEPRLLRLEPNANSRVIRRSFWDVHKLAFEAGLLFEDLPVHVASICHGGRVGMVNRTGYYYRVNRAGKITDQKSAKRFDMIRSATSSLDHAKASYMITPQAGASLLDMMLRMLYWCGCNTLAADRLRYFSQAADVIRSAPKEWLGEYMLAYKESKRNRLLMSLLVRGDAESLLRISMGMRPTIWASAKMVLSGQDHVVCSYAKTALLNITRRFFRGPWSIFRKAFA